jgi:glucose 1-dehydrogenase
MTQGQDGDGARSVVMPSQEIPAVLDDQVALITGASSGIGRGIAYAMAQAGADVVVNYVSDEEAAGEVADDLRAIGRRALIHRADVSDEAAVIAMFERACEELGGIDILVNNAGVQRDAPTDEMSLEQWQRVIDVNLTGQFLCARQAVRIFQRRGVDPQVSCAAGKIIFISSVHEVIPWAGHVNYAASKGGVQMLMKSIAQEVAEKRIRVNGIAPGAIKTSINRQAWDNAQARQELLELIPYNRIGEPSDIGRAAVWLASDQADYVTGTTLFVDGGMTLFPGFASGG